MTDIVSIMVEAARVEGERYTFEWDEDGTCYLSCEGDVLIDGDTEDACFAYAERFVVQAQLRALHAAGLGIGEIAAVGAGDDWRVEGPDLVSVALRENG